MAESRRTSLKDLAQILGVSIPTVSRALKNSPEISRELCAKVQKLAKEMNYHPNPFAMSLRKNTPRTIGVIVPDIVTHFFASILSGIEDLSLIHISLDGRPYRDLFKGSLNGNPPPQR